MKRQKEIIESCNYKVIDNNIIKDNKLLYKDIRNNEIKYYDVSSNQLRKELIRHNNDSSLKVRFNDNIELIYLENKDIFDDNYCNSYKISYKKGNNYQEILINIYRFTKKLMVGKIDLNSKQCKIGRDLETYSKVTIESFLDRSVVKGKYGNTIYKGSYYNTDMMAEVIRDYLNSIDICSNDIKSLFSNITKFIIEDIDLIFNNMDKEANNQIKSYEHELDGLEKYYASRKNIIKQKIKKFNTITRK